MFRVTQVVWLPFVFIPLSAASWGGVPFDPTNEAPRDAASAHRGCRCTAGYGRYALAMSASPESQTVVRPRETSLSRAHTAVKPSLREGHEIIQSAALPNMQDPSPVRYNITRDKVRKVPAWCH